MGARGGGGEISRLIAIRRDGNRFGSGEWGTEVIWLGGWVSGRAFEQVELAGNGWFWFRGCIVLNVGGYG